LRFVAHHSLRAFAYYRFGLAALVTGVLLGFGS
jgi:undecaprenyl pyrophosphate phosphatase UppP